VPDDAGSGLATVRRWLAHAVAAAAVVVGSGILLVALTLGRCDAFGGRCPADRPPLLQDDSFVLAAAGAALAVGMPVLLLVRPARRLAVGLAAAVLVALVTGLIGRAGHG